MVRAVRAVAATTSGLLLAALTLVPAIPAGAATNVEANSFNQFTPREVHIDPGDKVRWSVLGVSQHTVTSDRKGLFNSGPMGSGDTFSFRFKKEGTFRYFCKFHGDKGGVGMSGRVVVGDPQPPDGGGGDGDKIVVPRDFRTIQAAVDAAPEGARIVVEQGTYDESIEVITPGLTIEGVDRFRTIVTGRDQRDNGFFVHGADGVKIKNLTVRNFTGAGILFSDATHYRAVRVDSIKNRTYGLRSTDSYQGVFRDSFAYGSGDSGFLVDDCLGCGALIDNVVAKTNYMGYSGADSTGVTVRGSRFVGNGVGVVPNTLGGTLAPNRGTLVYGNTIRDNNYETIPSAGTSERHGLPFGTGVWLFGVRNNVVQDNDISGNGRYGVLVTQGLAGEPPVNNRVIANRIQDSGIYDLAWDGAGSDDCFDANVIEGPTGPPDIQTAYSCANRPFAGTPFAPVANDVAAAIADTQRDEQEPPEPVRPRCQVGAPGCRR